MVREIRRGKGVKEDKTQVLRAWVHVTEQLENIAAQHAHLIQSLCLSPESRPEASACHSTFRNSGKAAVLCWDDVGRWSLETLRGLIKGEIHLNKCSFLKACILFPSCCPFSCLWVSSLIRLLCSRYVLKGHFHLTFFFVLQIPK